MIWPNSCIHRNISLANHTSIRIGGPAEYFTQPTSPQELCDVVQQANQRELPIYVVGGGTNTLAPDYGLRGLVIHLGRVFRSIEIISEPDDVVVRVRCGGATTTSSLVAQACRHGWLGLDALAGLPGQLGGAIVMNAQNIGQFVRSVQLMTFEGEIKTLLAAALQFGYRHSMVEPGIIISVDLEFSKTSPNEATESIRQILMRRNNTQDLNWPSAGCAFRNPLDRAAGQLIDEAGLKGSRIGDAMISERHANFLINLGQAKSDDVLALMEYVQRRVRQTFGVEMEPELRILGQTWKTKVSR